MSTLGWLVILCWVPATGFLALHMRSMWTAEERNLPSWAVLIMAWMVFLVLSLSLFRISFEIMLPNWLREMAFVLIMLGTWTKFLGILIVRYGSDRGPSPRRRAQRDDTIGADS